MLPRRAKIVLCACVAACAGVWWNVMYHQHGTRADILARTQRLGETTVRRPPPAPTAGSTEAAQSTRRTPPAQSPIETDATGIDVDVVRAVQSELAHRGYEPGPADGLVHAVTRAAVMAYEHDHGLPLTGSPSEHLLKMMLFGVPAEAAKDRGREPAPQVRDVIRKVQDSLAALGYPIKVDGRIGRETARVIREFESQHGLKPSGRVSGSLLMKLHEATVHQQRRASAR